MKLDLLNVAAFTFALALSIAGAGLGGSHGSREGVPSAQRPAVAPAERMPDGTPALRDAGGTLAPLIAYRRIASATLVADRVLADLCEPDRIVAFTRYAERTLAGHRYAGKPKISGRDDIERILALRPELLLTSDLVDASYVARLREQGIHVFDLGQMRGLDTLLPTIRKIGLLLGAPERADRYAASLLRRMQSVSASLGARARPRALYLGVFGDRLFGAGRGTSYHDVITHAGLRDLAAESGLTGWPDLTAEQVLSLAPELLITRAGMGATLCRHAGLTGLAACRGDARLIELEGALLDDPGPGLLDATEALFEQAFAP